MLDRVFLIKLSMCACMKIKGSKHSMLLRSDHALKKTINFHKNIAYNIYINYLE